MISTQRLYRHVAAILVSAILLTGCANRGIGPSSFVSYSPPLLPIEIAYDLITGQIKVLLSGRISTPLGTFKAAFGATSIATGYNVVRTLTIITGTRKYVYELEHGRPYSIKLPSDENGQTGVRYSGTDDNLEIEIPNPTNETVAGLKQQLKNEHEAHQATVTASATPETVNITQPGQAENVDPFQLPTPLPRQNLNSQECQELIAQYTPNKFLYIPPECQDMFRAYQSYLRQQEYEARRNQEQQEYRDEAERLRKEQEAEKRRREIEKWANTIGGILRRRRG
jgi:hypothetical protein